ncbi:hypothetical protein ACFRCQ_23465 [Cytobacillus firmus]|uniref:hypothetical protein n=1 Tax=Cytobacillus TaxID=2675230 RepID=UPI001114ED19|nr:MULTISPECIES: hypothetical protein [Cytobacillus]
MFKLIEAIDRFSRLISENIAREVNRKTFLKTILTSAFAGIAVFSVNLNRTSAGALSWCEQWRSDSNCTPPWGKFCSGCTTSTKCPSGYKVSKAWGYSSTGCWCLPGGPGYDWTCCDCTKGADVTKTYSSDCGCKGSFKSNALT